ncbi:MAG: polysaccharide biosynthesis tyrosine autokinase, partial [Chloroflexota bacterium]|nr:polysaccharide biosynthesis tyrosine autokinase [Chloroflexota bacterium]
PAIPPEKPVRPRVLMNTALAAVVGGMLAVGAIFLIEALDDTIKNPDEVTRHLGLPILGTILRHEDNDDPIVVDSPRSPTAEAFRSLRTNIQYASVDYPIRTLLITSPSAGVGKSTIATNLGIVLAQGGSSTVLVDSDMRRPTIHKLLKLPNRLGLSSLFVHQSLVTGEVKLPDGVVQSATKVEGFSLIPSGKLPPNPSELLASEKMSNLIQRLKEEADIIVIDSPPVMAVTDATVLAPRVDGVLLIIKPGQTKLEAARQTVEQLRRVRANLLGVVLNEVDPKSSRYGYYNRYDRKYYHEEEEPKATGLGDWRLKVFGGLAALIVLIVGCFMFWPTISSWFGGGEPAISTPTESAVAVIGTEPTTTPKAGSVTPTRTLDRTKPTEENGPSQTPTTTPTITPTPTRTLPPTPGPSLYTPFGLEKEYILHQVKYGDNLPNLSDQYYTDRDVIVAANGLVPDVSLQPDQVIVIMPGRTDSLGVEPLSVLFLDEDYSISEFASQKGVTVEELRAYNALGPGGILPAGRWLIFPKRYVSLTPVPTKIPTPDLSKALTEPFGPNDEYVLHQVASGESIPIFNDIYLTSTAVIHASNVIEGSIHAGDVLVILPGRTDAGAMTRFSLIKIEEAIHVDALADQLDVLTSDILVYNNLTSGELISAGRWVIYPASYAVGALTSPNLNKALTDPFGPNDEYVLHQVAADESVFIIKDIYLTSADVIWAANDVKGSIQPGQVLVIIPERTEVGHTPKFSVIQVEEQIKVDDLAVQLDVLAADL